jgi:hypothetical protein
MIAPEVASALSTTAEDVDSRPQISAVLTAPATRVNAGRALLLPIFVLSLFV